jgi:3-oxoacyl-[acyl-carrier protein] reductase
MTETVSSLPSPVRLRRLAGQVALVTGSSRGIGAATARRLAAEGARVVVNYRADAAGAAQVVAGILAAGGEAIAVCADVRDPDAVMALREAVQARLGTVVILVNNAGTLQTGDALGLRRDALRDAIDVNVAAAVHCVQAFAPGMAALGRGRIVNVAATSAFGTTAAGIAPQAMAKSALLVWGKQLALQLGPQGVTVNAVCPGAIDTEVTLPGGALHEALADVRRRQVAATALRRTGSMEEVAGVIAFLASDDAAFVTGQALSVDGGRTDFLSHSG